MDHLRDAKPFRALMNELSAALRGGFDASDDMAAAYWKALKDMPFAEVKANIERVISTATRETSFPRPAALRNSPAVIASGLPSAVQLKAERESIKHWRELKVADPIAFEIEWHLARAFTELASCTPDSIEHDEWKRDCVRWNQLRYAPRAEQETAVAKLRAQP